MDNSTFTVSAPETATPDADESLRTISVGDYESLFGQKSPEEIEAERQAEVASGYLEQGNLYFWTTLSILIVAAVIQVNFTSEDSGRATPPRHESSTSSGNKKSAVTLGLAIGFGWQLTPHFHGDTP